MNRFLPRPAQLLKGPVAAVWAGYVALVGSTAVAVMNVAMIVLSTAFSLIQANRQKKKMKAMLAGLDEGRTEMIKDPLLGLSLHGPHAGHAPVAGDWANPLRQ